MRLTVTFKLTPEQGESPDTVCKMFNEFRAYVTDATKEGPFGFPVEKATLRWMLQKDAVPITPPIPEEPVDAVPV